MVGSARHRRVHRCVCEGTYRQIEGGVRSHFRPIKFGKDHVRTARQHDGNGALSDDRDARQGWFQARAVIVR